jgi:hypothetical protein
MRWFLVRRGRKSDSKVWLLGVHKNAIEPGDKSADSICLVDCQRIGGGKVDILNFHFVEIKVKDFALI